ncbi:MAG: class I SAM-dependent methyltransferase [Clostridia bacterium]|nr:class I SAM-dependent methyltransferase [Clostridia bacterium]
MNDFIKYLLEVDRKPLAFERYTADILWDDSHISKKMLEYHLNQSTELASRNEAFITKSADFIAKTFQLEKGDRLIDFGCGPGLYTSRFAEKGLEVTGVDFSRNSISYAKEDALRKHLDIEYICSNYLSFNSLKEHDMALLIYCDYCPLSKEQRKTLLHNIYQSLHQGAYFLLDVFTEKAYLKREGVTRSGKNLMNGFWAESDYYCFVNSFSYDDEKVFLDKYTVFTDEKVFEVYNWLKYFTVDEISSELKESGFKVLDFYGDVTGKPYHEDTEVVAIACMKE